MSTRPSDLPVLAKRRVPCEADIPALSATEINRLLTQTPRWILTPDGRRIRRSWSARDFPAALAFFQRVAELAEAQGHHPDLHLENYRAITIEIWTHALGGLSENDFILAAKIDQLPIAEQA